MSEKPSYALKAAILGLCLPFLTAASGPPSDGPDFNWKNSASGKIRPIDVDLLGPPPDYSLTAAFLAQIDRCVLDEDTNDVKAMVEHLKMHGLREGQVDSLRAVSIQIIEARGDTNQISR